MLCIAVTPTSRTLAKVDLLNAARRADLVELCLDHLSKDPDVGDLLPACPKPVIVSCRRPEYGGHYTGDEDHRRGLLRQAVLSGPAYVELDLEAAKAIPRFGDVKRIVAYHSAGKPLSKVDNVLEKAVAADADVVKFTWPTPTLNAAWPLLHAVSGKATGDRDLPVVGQGHGAGGTTFALAALRFGCPWVYAALEAGMEDFDGQPTVEALEATWDVRAMGTDARFVGLAGFPDGGVDAAERWNAAARDAGVPHRALPLDAGKTTHLGQMLKILRVGGVLLGPDADRDRWDEFAPPERGSAGPSDLLLPAGDGWAGRRAARHAAVAAFEAACGGPEKLARKTVTLLGSGPAAAALGRSLKKRGCTLSVAAPDDASAARLATALDARTVPFARVYGTFADAIVVAEPIPLGTGRSELNPSLVESRMTVLDATHPWTDGPFATAARDRMATTVGGEEIRRGVLAAAFGAVTGRPWPASNAPD